MGFDSYRGGWIQTYTGKRFYPFDPHPEDVCIEDIAHQLALTCRFTGAFREFYSVAQHSFHVSVCCPGNALSGLLHDAAEAYISDLAAPVKWGLPAYQQLEEGIWKVIAERFGVPVEKPADVQEADRIMLFTEARDLIKLQPNTWKDPVEPLDNFTVEPWSPQDAEGRFLNRYEFLIKDRA